MNIQLVNIDLSGVSKEKQIEKIAEEYIEFLLALGDFKDNPTEENKSHVIEEYLDYIQAPLGILDKLGVKADEVMQGYPKHLEKLKYRPRKCSKCGYKKNCCLYQSSEWKGDQEAEECTTYIDEVR